jgi:8-oxo-dGTP pyrophosphatase MutT (NUDIX family)
VTVDAGARPDWLPPLTEALADPVRSTSVVALRPGVGARPAAVLILIGSGPEILFVERPTTMRTHAGQIAFPGGAADPEDADLAATALREATEETGIEASRLQPLATLERMFIPPSGFHVVPVLAYAAEPGPVTVVDEAETALVAWVPVRAFVNPQNRITVYRSENTRRTAGPAFLLNEMLVWGFTGQVIAAMLDVAGWTVPWDTDNVYELSDAMALLDSEGSYGEAQL